MTVQLMTIPAEALDLIVYDFDGVMTDNRVYVLEDGREFVACNRSDGLGVSMIQALGLPQVIISTETNSVVQARARKLKLEAIHGCKDKLVALQDYCVTHRYVLARVLYVGNDVNDLDAMQAVGFPVSPADGHPRIRAMACLVTEAKGGAGVIRELADRIVSCSRMDEIKRNETH